MYASLKPRTVKCEVQTVGDSAIELTWPWWLHPAWALILLSGSMAAIAAAVPAETFAAAWSVRKYLDPEATQLMFICIIVMLFGVIFSSGMAARGGTATVVMTASQVTYMKRAYKLLLFLTFTGYVTFFGYAFIQGVGLAEMVAVLQRDEFAIYRLKTQVRTIPGLTTMTQFGPIAAVLGFILHRLGYAGRGYLAILALSLLRVIFYSERLALIEVLVPLILIAVLTVDRNSPNVKWVGLAPAVIAPTVWAVFAASEYFRSWVHYQFTTELAFTEWVSLRLFGYYTTSFNNSALFMQAHEGTYALPYYSIGVLWDAPILSSLISHPGIAGVDAEKWWPYTLASYSSPEFNNEGSFLTAYAEFGPVLGLAFLLCVGLALGAMFASMSKGRIAGLLSYTTLFIGILELPRFIYWTEGRAFPVLLALVVVAVTFPREQKKPTFQKSLKPSSVR